MLEGIYRLERVQPGREPFEGSLDEKPAFLALQEILFSPGPKCENMLFVAYGTVGYMCKAAE